ncbi:MAG: CDGSH iron-sulfur domain-containing protein, partial [Pseudomonadota bacterium]
MVRWPFTEPARGVDMASNGAGDGPTIECKENGPYLVRGLGGLTGPAGEPIQAKPVMALCRCGGSANKPFCDGTHAKNGFSGERLSGGSIDRRDTLAGAAIAWQQVSDLFHAAARNEAEEAPHQVRIAAAGFVFKHIETDPQVLVYSSPSANEAIAAADVVLAVGTSIGETTQYGSHHHWEKGNQDRKWIYIERDPANIGVNRPIDVPLIGDLTDVLPQLAEALEQSGGRSMVAALTSWRQRLEAERTALIESAPDTDPIHPGRMIAEATSVLPDDCVIVRDGGCTSLWELGYHVIKSRDYLWPSKFGHLGAGLPYALGAQLAVGDARRVCLITGDSAFQFHISEIETAV